ncbi:MAG TPA: beta-ketoacyl-[acyl-carrier-protein] synthase family protein [Steroidobacteraceae bacterium]|jgi:3-oxoacyl-[acyl-carrier-protein] synthase-1|nr:beta-ketoacyl-[acyl-carrier-protein] synthase family protein [Steroidobacteraceae bacterium]
MSSRALPLSITAYTASCAAGNGRAALLTALRARRSGLTRNDFTEAPLETWIGRVHGLESQPLPGHLAQWECRNDRLAWHGLQFDDFLLAVAAARERYGAGRIALVMGTSTSSIGATEEGYRRVLPDGQYPEDLRRPAVHSVHSLGEFVQAALGLTGTTVTVATACSSSAKVFAQAERLIRLGLADAAVVGGVDTLCNSVLFGFNALELVSAEPCRPFDRARRGISLGEAAGFALLEREGDGPWLLGYGESSDAHHMSSPHPQGTGARLAIEGALARSGVAAQDIDYINLHGTASQKNDEVEARIVAEMFPARTRASSTKGWMGHTLGAAGIVEAVIALLALETGLMPGTLNTADLDEACGPQIRLDNDEGEVRFAMSNSFGFGGSNCTLLFGRERTP